MLTSLQSQLGLGLAVDTFQSQDNLLGGLSLLVENWLGLTTETGLLTVVSSLTLSEQGSLTSLVLGDLVLGVLSALLTLTESLSKLWNVNWMLVMPKEKDEATVTRREWRENRRIIYDWHLQISVKLQSCAWPIWQTYVRGSRLTDINRIMWMVGFILQALWDRISSCYLCSTYPLLLLISV